MREPDEVLVMQKSGKARLVGRYGNRWGCPLCGEDLGPTSVDPGKVGDCACFDEGGPVMVKCPYCGNMHQKGLVEDCPSNPNK
jgi:hypothetical protein